MTRKEQIEQTAYRYATKRQEDPNYPAYNWETEITDAFIEGAKYADEHPDLYSVTRKAVERALENLWYDAQGDELPEIDREVIVLCQDYEEDPMYLRVAYGHRPNPNGWDGKSFTSDEITHYEPMLYDKGGWNQPNVKWWLDVSIPNLEE